MDYSHLTYFDEYIKCMKKIDIGNELKCKQIILEMLQNIN